MRVTLRDIAREAGASIATVSLALRGCGDVAKERAEHIRAVARKLGYRPNPMLAALASKQFSAAKDLQGTPIALFEFPLIPDKSGGKGGTIEGYRKFLIAEARQLGYAPTVYSFPSPTAPERLFNELYARSTLGILLTGSVDMAGVGRAFDWQPFSIVQCARYFAEYPFHTVRPNIFQSIKLAFNTLLDRGYKRIGFAPGRHEAVLEDDEERHGTAIALEYAHLAHRNRLPVYLGSFAEKEPFLQWFKRHTPDAVVGFGIRQYWFLREAGVRIPEDVGFVSMHFGADDSDISGVKQDSQEIARQSVHMLDQLIRHREQGPVERPKHLLIASRWQEGKTVRPPSP